MEQNNAVVDDISDVVLKGYRFPEGFEYKRTSFKNPNNPNTHILQVYSDAFNKSNMQLAENLSKKGYNFHVVEKKRVSHMKYNFKNHTYDLYNINK